MIAFLIYMDVIIDIYLLAFESGHKIRKEKIHHENEETMKIITSFGAMKIL